jgi:phage portal protein BeeE
MLKQANNFPMVMQVVSRIAESTASVPFTVSRVVGAGGKSVRSRKLERMPMQMRQKHILAMKRAGDLEELPDDPLLDFLDAGNTHMSGFETRELMGKHLELVGETIAWKERDAFGKPVRLWPLVPTWVIDVPQPGEDTYRVRITSGTERKLPARDILRIRISDPFSPYGRGAGIAMSLADEIDTDEYAATFSKAFFYNHGTPGGIVSFDNVGQPEIDRFEEQWKEQHRGAERGFLWHFFGQKADVNVLDAGYKDQGVVELRKFLRGVSRETWGIPPEIVGVIEDSNRATIEAAGFIFAQWLLVPRCQRWMGALQAQVAPDFDERKLIGYESPVPEDKEHRLNAMKAAPYTIKDNEWREVQGFEPVDDGEAYTMLATEVRRPAGEMQPPRTPTPPRPTQAMVDESKRIGAGPARKASGIDFSDIDLVVDAVTAAHLAERTTALWEDELRQWGDGVLAELGIEAAFDLLNPAVLQHLEAFGGERISGINETTQAAIRAQLLEGVEAGEDYRALRRRVRDVFSDATMRRATLIARTEPAISANFATYQAHRQSGVVSRRGWLSTLDGRARPMHEEMNQVEVALGEAFRFSDGVETMYPCGSGVAHHDIQCRCTTYAVIEDKAAPGGTRKIYLVRGFEDDLDSWSGRAESAFRAGFRSQEADTIDTLRQLAERRGAA